MPRFSFFISYSKEPVTQDSPIWHEPIPLRLDTLIKHDGHGESISHAAYFRAARSCLEANSFEVITRAVSRQLNRDVTASDIEEIRIRLEKHGEFYHPSRIETVVNQQQLSFVLNVAISETGRRFIEAEFHLINRLNTEQPLHYLPQAYGLGRADGLNGESFAMFLGQWFEGYHEFHTSFDPVDKILKIMVWDDVRGRFFLSVEQTQTLYALVSKILTSYYNLESFEQVFSWHHAAGDFIVRVKNEKLDLKLVSVRRYEAIFGDQKNTQTTPVDPQQILQALLIFFLNLSIHIRLDRLDGIGEMVWSDSLAVEATLVGFLEALSMKPDIPFLPDSPLACFVAYLTSCSEKDLIDLTGAIINRSNPQMPGLAVVKKNINTHGEILYASIQQILSI
ncbi:MAG: hypothetical protein PVG96_01715 [Desulfobacterales bacterium]|jgi:hypothetical protein